MAVSWQGCQSNEVMGGLVSLIANALGIVSGWLGLQSKKLDLRNSPDMKQAAEASDEQKAVDKTNVAVANKDPQEIRRELAE